MRSGFLSRITTDSTLAELPGHEASLELSDKAKRAGDFFHQHPEVPGLLLTDQGRFHSVLSRRHYLDVVGRYCGMDLYHPRPIEFMMSRHAEAGGPLVLPGDLRIGEAVRRGLERPRALLYEPLAVRSSGGEVGESVRLIDFEDLLAAESRVTQLRAGQMRQILATVREGLLLIDREHRIGLEYAGSVEEILEARGLAGARLPEVLAGVLDAERVQLAADYLDMLFDPRVIESLIAKINPLLQVEARFGGGRRKTLAFRFTRGMGAGVDSGTIRHVLVRIEDLTREAELAREVEAQQRRSEQRLRLALALVQADPEATVALLDRIDRQIRRAGRAGDLLEPVELRRELHGCKGEASLLGFTPLAQEIHQIEDALAASPTSPGPVGERLAALGALVAEVRAVKEQLTRLGRSEAPTAKAEPEPEGLPASLERFVAGLAAELGKPARFVWRANGLELPPRYAPVVREALAQLARNSLVHGVESPDERLRRGKPAQATLQFAARCRPEEQRIELIFQDDGGGLDLEALRARAGQLQLGAMSEGALRELIFQPGFSTAADPTLHGGRGVGLDLVRSRIEELGGRVAVHSQPGRFCAFQLLLPLPQEPAP